MLHGTTYVMSLKQFYLMEAESGMVAASMWKEGGIGWFQGTKYWLYKINKSERPTVQRIDSKKFLYYIWWELE